MNQRNQCAFTLVEMLVATAVGMLVVQIAFTSFFFIQKYVRRIERIEATNQVAQTALLWSISKPTKLTAADYPSGSGLVNQIGCVSATQVNVAHNIYNFIIHDYSSPAYIHWLDKQLMIPVQP